MNGQNENIETVEYYQQKVSIGGECLSAGGNRDLDDKH